MRFVKAALDLLMRRKAAFRRVCAGPDGAIVLQHLCRFCRAYTTTFDPDPRIHARLEGRREVWLLFQNYLHLTPEQLAVIYQAATFEEKNE